MIYGGSVCFDVGPQVYVTVDPVDRTQAICEYLTLKEDAKQQRQQRQRDKFDDYMIVSAVVVVLHGKERKQFRGIRV